MDTSPEMYIRTDISTLDEILTVISSNRLTVIDPLIQQFTEGPRAD